MLLSNNKVADAICELPTLNNELALKLFSYSLNGKIIYLTSKESLLKEISLVMLPSSDNLPFVFVILRPLELAVCSEFAKSTDELEVNPSPFDFVRIVFAPRL